MSRKFHHSVMHFYTDTGGNLFAMKLSQDVLLDLHIVFHGPDASPRGSPLISAARRQRMSPNLLQQSLRGSRKYPQGRHR